MNKPLYPNSDYPENEGTKQRPQSSMFESLSSIFSQGSQNPLLSLLLGMKGGNGDMFSNLFGKIGASNPLFQAFSTTSANKKESDSSPKNILQDDVIF